MFVTTAKKLGALENSKDIEKAWKHVRRFKKVGDQVKALEKLITKSSQEKATPEPDAKVSKKKANKRFDRFSTSLAGYQKFFTENNHVTMISIMPNNSAAIEALEKNLRTLADTISEARKSYLEKTSTDNIK